ncbi:MAG: hypothetical protein J5985_08260 [Kiritimatiellae bacterium]|nr:hypothetical protein [Kiritimatiellia bacterium]
MIESIFVIVLVCLCFFGVYQYASLYSTKAVLYHAAACAARARSVGFNEWMARKSALAASIPVSGPRITPAGAGGLDDRLASSLLDRGANLWDAALRASTRSPAAAIEAARLPEFMEGVNEPTARGILDYAYWDNTHVDLDEPIALGEDSPGVLTAVVRQRHPLLLRLGALAEGEQEAPDENGRDDFAVRGVFSIESHYPLYLEDAKW